MPMDIPALKPGEGAEPDPAPAPEPSPAPATAYSPDALLMHQDFLMARLDSAEARLIMRDQLAAVTTNTDAIRDHAAVAMLPVERSEVWVRAAVATLAQHWDKGPGTCAARADELLAEYDKRAAAGKFSPAPSPAPASGSSRA